MPLCSLITGSFIYTMSLIQESILLPHSVIQILTNTNGKVAFSIYELKLPYHFVFNVEQDYVALLPEQYYTGSVLRFISTQPCEVRKFFNKHCSMFKYYTTTDPDVVTVQASHGFQNNGIPVLGFNEPKFALSRVSFGNKMALLGRSQVTVVFSYY